ncbi:MAG: GNAT family N-acetyltransferase [Ktedonobacterales bacterium]
MSVQSDSAVHSPDVSHTHIPVPADAQRLVGTVTARDGTVLRVRPLLSTDRERLQTFHAGLSLDTIVFRFFRVLPSLSTQTARHLTHIDYENRMAVIAATGEGKDERIRAVVRYERTGPDTAEVAFVVDDALQGQGIAPVLLRRLAEYARERGFATLVAITMASNNRMIALLRHAGFPFTAAYEDGELVVRLDIREAPAVE